jgi:hypothetical protein
VSFALASVSRNLWKSYDRVEESAVSLRNMNNSSLAPLPALVTSVFGALEMFGAGHSDFALLDRQTDPTTWDKVQIGTVFGGRAMDFLVGGISTAVLSGKYEDQAGMLWHFMPADGLLTH